MEANRTDGSESLAQKWAALDDVRQQISESLFVVAEERTGADRRRLYSMATWFASNQEIQLVKTHSDLLTICQPLLVATVDGKIESSSILPAVQIAAGSLSPNISTTRRMLVALWYPLLVLLGCLVMTVLFSVWVLPWFDELYEEFGISLPLATTFLLKTGAVIRTIWPVLAALPILVIVAWVGAGIIGGRRGAGGMSWLDQKLMSKRNSLAYWARHLGLLLETGFSQADALQIAGSASNWSVISVVSSAWSRSLADRKRSSLRDFNLGYKYEALNAAVRLPMSSGKPVVLKEVAFYYWDHSVGVGDWLLEWLALLLLFILGGGILFAVFALFAPALSIVSGLI